MTCYLAIQLIQVGKNRRSVKVKGKRFAARSSVSYYLAIQLIKVGKNRRQVTVEKETMGLWHKFTVFLPHPVISDKGRTLPIGF